jgi:hypothetical protein
MASKRSVTKQVPKVKILVQLSQRARRDTEKLLKRSEARTMTIVELNAGFKEVEASLKQMLNYIDTTLDDMSKLLKRAKAKTITREELNIGLFEGRRRLKLMYNWGNGWHHPH